MRITPTYPELLASGASAELTLGDRVSGLDPLVRRAQEGDAAAFRDLFALHKDRVASIVFRFLGQSADVDDVVQEVFLHVHRSLPRFRGDSRFTTWLYRLTANVTKMHLRRRASRPRVVDVEVPDLPRHAEPPEGPDDALARQLRVRALYRLLERLSEKKRMVLVLHDLEGLPAAEIAEVVEAPIMTVRTRLFYARRDLYAMFEEEPTLASLVQELSTPLRGQSARGASAMAEDES